MLYPVGETNYSTDQDEEKMKGNSKKRTGLRVLTVLAVVVLAVVTIFLLGPRAKINPDVRAIQLPPR